MEGDKLFADSSLFVTSVDGRKKRPETSFDGANIDDDVSSFVASIQYLLFSKSSNDNKKSSKVLVKGLSENVLSHLKRLFPDFQFVQKVSKGIEFLIYNFPTLTYKSLRDQYGSDSFKNQDKVELDIRKELKAYYKKHEKSCLDIMKKNGIEKSVSKFRPFDDTTYLTGIPAWGVRSTDLWLMSERSDLAEWNFQEMDSIIYQHSLSRSDEYKNVLGLDFYFEDFGNSFDETAEMYTYLLYHGKYRPKQNKNKFCVELGQEIRNLII